MSIDKHPDCSEELEQTPQVTPDSDTLAEIVENEPSAQDTSAPAEKSAVPAGESAAESAPTDPVDTVPPEEMPVPKAKLGWLRAVGICITAAVFSLLFLLVLGDPSGSNSPIGNEMDPTGGVELVQPDTAPTLPDPTVPPTAPTDGNPDDITCQGSYSVMNTTHTAGDVVATVGSQTLTNAQLQVYYWQEVYRYLTENSNHGISLNHTLDVQMCPVADTPMTWQQYFLQRALDTWHVYQALALESDAHDFGLDESYRAYLDSLPEALENAATEKGYADAEALIAAFSGPGVSVEDFCHYVRLYEEGHIYFDRVYQTTSPSANQIAGYYSANEETYAAVDGKYVDIRHIMLTPDGSNAQAWDACKQEAEELLNKWKWNATDINFADLAFEYSQDPGSNHNGGLYKNVYDGMFADEINAWCFDSSRRKGDTEIFKTKDGYHIFYFSAGYDARHTAAEKDLIAASVSLLVPQALEAFPLTVDYSAIAIGSANLAGLDAKGIDNRRCVLDDLCQKFPDASYERYPEIPLYLQQDYGHVYYGGPGDTIVTHGCGIATIAMLSTYMTDTEQSIEEIAARFRGYGSSNGTSRNLYDEAPITMDYYLDTRVTTWDQVIEALGNGKLVVSLQHKGRFTNGGHYLLLYAVTDEGRIMIRDSNRYNYTTRFVNTDFYENGFPPEYFPPANVVFWVYEPKVTQIPACARCGDPETEGLPTALIVDTYYCPKCATALHLREIYDTACDIDLLDQIAPPVIDDDVVVVDPTPTNPPATRPTVPEPDETTPDESTPDESIPDESIPDESIPDESIPDESIPDESTPVESTPVESTPVESTPVESSPSDSQPAPAPDPAPAE